ncbi:MAG: hypothetical protein ACEPOW_12910 [Bacteroidales bacterium]
MKTRGFLKARRLAYVIFILSFFMLLAGCQKNFDITPEYIAQEKAAMTAWIGYDLNPSYLATKEMGMPAVSVNDNGQVAQVAVNSEGGLSYQTGVEAADGNISWNNAVKYSSEGHDPYVGINSKKTVVEISGVDGGVFGSGNHLIYHVGKLSDDNKTISFGNGQNFDNGESPKIVINNNNVVVEVHKSQSNFGLWCHVGIADPNTGTIAWGQGSRYEATGQFPSITINNNNMVIESHQSQTYGTLFFRVGTVNVDTKTISWGACHKYQTGMEPDIALLDNNKFLEVHKTQKPFCNELYSLSGVITGTGTNAYVSLLSKSSKLSKSGIAPVISANNNKQMVLSFDNGQGMVFGGDIVPR